MNKKVVNFIKNQYNVNAEYLWADTPNFAIFRNSRNNKWFCVLMKDLSKSKFGLTCDDSIDVINLKCDPLLKYSLINNSGIFPAYHMNKEHWISVFLDGSVSIEEIKNLINMSYFLVDKK